MAAPIGSARRDCAARDLADGLVWRRSSRRLAAGGRVARSRFVSGGRVARSRFASGGRVGRSRPFSGGRLAGDTRKLGGDPLTTPPSISSRSTSYLSFCPNLTDCLSIGEAHTCAMAGPIPRRTRDEALRAALREAVRGSPPPSSSAVAAPSSAAAAPSSAVAAPSSAAPSDRGRRRRLADLWRIEATEFVRGIVETAALIEAARGGSGEPVFRTDPQYKLLAGLERIGGWPSISEIARELGVSRQAARQQVVAAARGGLLELVPDPYDRRSIQIGLSLAGKRELGAARVRELVLVTTLLSGLGDRDMRLVAHVLRVLRARLLRAGHEQTAARQPSQGRMRASRERARR